MSVTYNLKIKNNRRIIPIEYATSTNLLEVDKYTFNRFESMDDMLSKYNVINTLTSNNYAYISYQYNEQIYEIRDIVFKEDALLFDTRDLRAVLDTYASYRDKTNINFISLVARTFIKFKGYEGICGNILNKLLSDCSSEYFAFLRGIFKEPDKNYRQIRELYFLRKLHEEMKIKYNAPLYKNNEQINMFDYMNESKNGISK